MKTVTLNENTREVTIGEEVVQLSEQEFRLLALLKANSGLMVSAPRIIQMIWHGTPKAQWKSDAVSNTLGRLVFRLRMRVGRKCIQSIRGRGYRWLDR